VMNKNRVHLSCTYLFFFLRFWGLNSSLEHVEHTYFTT
jgi:hypothetical protein